MHVDQSYSGTEARVRRHLPLEADHLLRGRVQILNAWRPLRTMKRDPLGVMDARSVRDDDLVALGVVFPDEGRRGETFVVRPPEWDGHRGERVEDGNVGREGPTSERERSRDASGIRDGKGVGEGHRWYYLSQQMKEEILVFKIFDSKTDGTARRVPHSSFVDPEFENEGGEGVGPRESIEVRALVFHPENRG